MTGKHLHFEFGEHFRQFDRSIHTALQSGLAWYRDAPTQSGHRDGPCVHRSERAQVLPGDGRQQCPFLTARLLGTRTVREETTDVDHGGRLKPFDEPQMARKQSESVERKSDRAGDHDQARTEPVQESTTLGPTGSMFRSPQDPHNLALSWRSTPCRPHTAGRGGVGVGIGGGVARSVGIGVPRFSTGHDRTAAPSSLNLAGRSEPSTRQQAPRNPAPALVVAIKNGNRRPAR